MNIYKYSFSVECPSGGELSEYHITIYHDQIIMAEDIVRFCAFVRPLYHEQIADILQGFLPGQQVIRASHCGVSIETRRKGIRG